MSKSVNVVVLGYGMAGKSIHSYLVNLARPYLNLYGIYVLSQKSREEALKDYPKAIIFKSYEEVLADPKVDVIVVATPNALHAASTIQALQAGKHVVVDKPFALRVGEAQKMLQAQKQGQVLSCFNNRRLDGDFLTVQKLIQDGSLGNVRWVELAYQKGQSPKVWKSTDIRDGAGRFFDLGAHLLDQALTIFAAHSVTSVYARFHTDFPGGLVDSHCLIVLTFSNGATAIVDVGSMTTIEKPRFYVVGDKATFQKFGMDPQENAMMAGNIDSAVEDPATFGVLKPRNGDPPVTVPTIKGTWRRYYENIGLAVQGKEQPLVSAWEAYRVVMVFEAALLSARGGVPLALDHPPSLATGTGLVTPPPVVVNTNIPPANFSARL